MLPEEEALKLKKGKEKESGMALAQDADSPIWVPDRLIRHVSASRIPSSTAAATPKEERASSAFAPPASTGNTTDIGATDIGDPG